ncbi:MAG: hypothetical protein GY862_03275 [Gammaproteobacteria bacterium]|nr:hypothetical protein [Gammaproteobacteria bacterium]
MMTNLTLSLNDSLVQKIRSQASIQNVPLEQFIADILQKQLAKQAAGTCKPKRTGRYRSGRENISAQAKTLARQLGICSRSLIVGGKTNTRNMRKFNFSEPPP